MQIFRRIFFFFWYYRNPPWDTGISPPELISFIRSHPPGRALDLGCGTGTNAITLAQAGWQVTGVDFAWNAVQRARNKARKASVQVEFFAEDVTHISHLTAPYDLILDIGCFHNLSSEEKRSYKRNLERLLAPNGTFLLYGFLANPEDPGQAHGITEADMKAFQNFLVQQSRRDGSERRIRPSTWLEYLRPSA